MAVRPDGSVVITGFFVGWTNDYNFLTICYAADGTPQWTNFYDGPSSGADMASYIAVGTNGDVWVAGQSMRESDYGTNFSFTDAVLICYASNGIPLWTNRYTTTEPHGDSPSALAVDSSGNAYLKLMSTYWHPPFGYGTPVGDIVVKV